MTETPTRAKWQAQVRAWPEERRLRFEAALALRRWKLPAESQDWAFVAAFREFREGELRAGRLTYAEAYGEPLPANAQGLDAIPATEDVARFQRLMRDVLKRTQVVKARPQLRLLPIETEPNRRWD